MILFRIHCQSLCCYSLACGANMVATHIICDALICWSCSGEWQPRTLYYLTTVVCIFLTTLITVLSDDICLYYPTTYANLQYFKFSLQESPPLTLLKHHHKHRCCRQAQNSPWTATCISCPSNPMSWRPGTKMGVGTQRGVTLTCPQGQTTLQRQLS